MSYIDRGAPIGQLVPPAPGPSEADHTAPPVPGLSEADHTAPPAPGLSEADHAVPPAPGLNEADHTTPPGVALPDTGAAPINEWYRLSHYVVDSVSSRTIHLALYHIVWVLHAIK